MSEYKNVFGQNAVIHTPTSRVVYLDNPSTVHTDRYLEWVAKGNAADEADVPSPAQPPTPEQIITQYTAAIQSRLDDFAKTRNYDGILAACTYATSSVPKFASEGQYCVGARDATWAAAYSLLAEVEAATRPMPTLIEVLAALPDLVWPA